MLLNEGNSDEVVRRPAVDEEGSGPAAEGAGKTEEWVIGLAGEREDGHERGWILRESLR
jgi:hypothetical protein